MDSGPRKSAAVSTPGFFFRQLWDGVVFTPVTGSRRTNHPSIAMKQPQPHRRLRRNGGFTLLEMVIVLGIIAMLLGGAIYSSLGILGSSKMGRADTDFQTISSNLMQYKTANGMYPSNQQGLRALVERPSSNPVPRRWSPIMKKLPIDPWDNEYIYRFPGKKNAMEPEILSKGPDGLENTADDLSSQDTK